MGNGGMVGRGVDGRPGMDSGLEVDIRQEMYGRLELGDGQVEGKKEEEGRIFSSSSTLRLFR